MYRLLIKKGNEDSENTVYDTYTQWGIVCSECPFKVFGEAKELPQNDWKDEDGADVYEPDELYLSAYSMDVEFVCKGMANDVTPIRSKIRSFLNYLTGKDGTGVAMCIYDTYTKIGRQGIFFHSVDNDLYFNQRVNGTGMEEVATFKVNFHVCDPTTDLTLSV